MSFLLKCGAASLLMGVTVAGLKWGSGHERVPEAPAPDVDKRVPPTGQPPKQATPKAERMPVGEPPRVRRAGACSKIPILNVYKQAGALLEQTEEHFVLELRINLHGADCGAPDGYGHTSTLTVRLSDEGDSCRIKSAHARSETFGCTDDACKQTSWEDEFQPSDIYDLSEHRLHDIELRDFKTEHAIVLGRRDYYFFEGAKKGKQLRRALRGEWDDDQFVYGYTSSAALREWMWLYQPPAAYASYSKADPGSPAALEMFNKWSSGADLRDHLGELVARTFPEDRNPDARLLGGSPAMTAIVVGKADYDDKTGDSREITLKFSRKACGDCARGVSGWWLYEASQRWKCHETGKYSTTPCEP